MFRGLVFPLVALFSASSAATGQTAAPQTAAPQTAQQLKIGNIVVQGSIRARVESWDWFQTPLADGNYTFSGNILRLSLSRSTNRFDWQFELAAPLLAGLPSNAVAPGTQGQLGLGATYYVANSRNSFSAMVFPKQGFLRFKNLADNPANSLRLGRFEYADGSEVTPKNATLAALKRDRINMRLLGHFAWAHVGRSFDGAHYVYNKPKDNFALVAALAARGAYQTDGWGELRVGVSYGAYTKTWGNGRHTAETRLLALYYQDGRHIVKTDSRPAAVRSSDLANIRIVTFGGHHLSTVTTAAGTVDFLFWGVAQTGTWGTLSHRAWATALEGGFQPKVLTPLHPWLRAGFFEGSGDKDPSDRNHGTFFQVLPTPRPFARFPFFNLMNNRDYNADLILRTHPKVTLGMEFHALSLASRQDLWYLGGGAFQPWTFGYTGRNAAGANSLANLWDIGAEYRVRPDVTLAAYFGYAAGKSVIRAIYPAGVDGRMGYLEVTYRF